MITQARWEHPELVVGRRCVLPGVSRSWYYGRVKAAAPSERDLAPLELSPDASQRAPVCKPLAIALGSGQLRQQIRRDPCCR